MLDRKDCSPAGLTQHKGMQGRDRLKLGALLYKGFHHPAVHVDGLASDEFRPIRREESDHVCDILRVTVVRQGNVLLLSLIHI